MRLQKDGTTICPLHQEKKMNLTKSRQQKDKPFERDMILFLSDGFLFLRATSQAGMLERT